MPRYTVQTSATMHAPPEVVWDILTDYQTDHPRILPKGFSPLLVERGGKGAGTVIRFSVRTLGITQEYRGEVTTQEPGHLLVENYANNGSVTTFTVTSVDNGQGADVRISTELNGRSGLPGAIERAMTRMVMSRLYREELGKLAALATSRRVASQPVN